jgi:uncharacterized membrane protein
MNKRHILLCLLLIAAASAATVWYWPQLPEQVPTHWNYAGQVDGHSRRATLWLLGPGLMAAMLALGVALPWLSPARFDLRRSGPTYAYMITVVVAMLGSVYAMVLAAILGGQVALPRALPALISLLYILFGNPMGKLRRNFYVGVRTPWTLASERVWYATHRLAGKLMVGAGLLGLLAATLDAPHWVALVLLLAAPLLPVLYSLLYYKRLERTHQLES